MKKFRYTGKKIAALVLAGVMGFSITASATTESEIKKQQQATQKQLDQINSQMKSIEGQRNSILSQVNSLNSELTNLILNIQLLESDIEAKAEEVDQAQADYEAAKQKEEEQYEAMKLRIQYIYEEGDMDYLSLFLQAENFSDFLNRADFAQEIQTKDREMFLEYQETKQEVADLLEELEHIRRKGCAIENGEYKIGLRSVSAPVFDREGQMHYTLTVVGLFRHVTSGEFEEAVDMVCAAAGSLSRELGYHA